MTRVTVHCPCGEEYSRSYLLSLGTATLAKVCWEAFRRVAATYSRQIWDIGSAVYQNKYGNTMWLV